MSKNKLLQDKLKQALNYNKTHYIIVGKYNNNVVLNKSDLQYLINLLENGK